MRTSPPALQDVLDAMDKAFSPDIRMIVDGDESIILACQAITSDGVKFLLHNSILEKSYDDISFPDLCTEVIFRDEL